jgi:hypothetical protein
MCIRKYIVKELYFIEEQLSDLKYTLKTGMETYTDKYLIKE